MRNFVPDILPFVWIFLNESFFYGFNFKQMFCILLMLFNVLWKLKRDLKSNCEWCVHGLVGNWKTTLYSGLEVRTVESLIWWREYLVMKSNNVVAQGKSGNMNFQMELVRTWRAAYKCVGGRWFGDRTENQCSYCR